MNVVRIFVRRMRALFERSSGALSEFARRDEQKFARRSSPPLLLFALRQRLPQMVFDFINRLVQILRRPFDLEEIAGNIHAGRTGINLALLVMVGVFAHVHVDLHDLRREFLQPRKFFLDVLPHRRRKLDPHRADIDDHMERLSLIRGKSSSEKKSPRTFGDDGVRA